MTPTSFFAFQSVLVLILASLATLTASAPTKSHRIITNLIHPDSVLSPFYNPNDTVEDRAQRFLTSSDERSAYLQYRINKDQLEGPSTVLIPARIGFVVYIPFGQPPISQYMWIDTGSPLTWVRCETCTNCELLDPAYDYRKSSTYHQLKCEDSFCRPFAQCELGYGCRFSIVYGDNTTASGYLGTEELIIKSVQGETTTVWNIPFGCADNVSTSVGMPYDGMLGLSENAISITGIIPRFSHCVGNMDDPLYKYNFLILGGDSYVKSYSSSTPYTLAHSLYYISLDGISIGDKNINFDIIDFKDGLIVDSGTPYTYLPPVVYYKIRAEVSRIMNAHMYRQVVYTGQRSWKLCYNGTTKNPFLKRIMPVITFHFAEGADLEVDATGTFHQSRGNEICMGMKPNRGVSIIGMMAQQYHNVVYELTERRIYFDPMDCEWLMYH